MRIYAWFLRLIIAVNFGLFALSFWPRFEGGANRIGLADQIFGEYRLSGFRVDFAWLALSTFAVFAGALFLLSEFRRDRRACIDLFLSVGWLIAFVIYIYQGVRSGVLDFG
jgi:hypothetical protein